MPTKSISSALLLIAASAASAASAQTSVLVGGGYAAPSVLSVAPGQVLTLFATGVGRDLSVRAPLKGSATGLSVAVIPGGTGNALPAPILAAMLIDTCQSNRTPTSCSGAMIAAISVQIPLELVPGDRPEAVLRIAERGVVATDLRVNIVESRVHFILGRHPLALDVVDGISKGASVFHADGTIVSGSTPGKAGETLVVYGYGFGVPERALRTGEAAESVNPVPVRGDLQFSISLPERQALTIPPEQPLGRYISYFGVTPGTIGVYQMNFVVPPISDAIRRCGGSTPTNFIVTYNEGAVASNFAFCVEP